MSDQHAWHQPGSRLGILLVNLGTPEAPTPLAVGRFLREFLFDRRVVDFPRVLWWFILNLIIVPLRKRTAARQYKKVWLAEGSPLMVNSQRQAKALQAAILNQPKQFPSGCVVELGMTYGQPSIASALQQLREQRVQKLLILPLYPQYSATTTGAVFDAVARELSAWRWVPSYRFINQYADEMGYIKALVGSVQQHWKEHERGDCLLISFHGLPERSLKEGDPYYCYCHKTARLMAEELGLEDDQWRMVFQSRFGREPWLQPYCDQTLRELPAQGKLSVDIICPGFAADCIETLEEVAIRNREIFLEAGGKVYQYILALNDRAEHIEALVEIVKKNTFGWSLL